MEHEAQATSNISTSETIATRLTAEVPAAIATQMILESKLPQRTGVVIPTTPDLYNPVLDELAREGIVCHET